MVGILQGKILGDDGKRSGTAKLPSLKAALASSYAGSGWLTVTGLVMLADTLISLAGLLIDPALVDGAPAWLKPLKFGISTSIFSFTVAWMIGQLQKTQRFASVLGTVMAVALVLEIGLIDLQAARHTASHFNQATAFDRGVFAVMGMVIGVVFLSTLLLFVASCVERFADRSLAWTLRLSLAIAISSMGVGVLMTLPTPGQLATFHATGNSSRTGAHTVGAPDGGAVMPVTGWSADHGDLRIAHFIGLHAMQALVLAWWLTAVRTQWPEPKRRGLISFTAIASVFAMALVLWQALRGQPLLKPDGLTCSGWGAWLAIVAAGMIWIANTQMAVGRFNPTPQRKGKRG